MLVAIVLRVLERVLGDYVSSRLTHKSEPSLTRADVIALVKEEIATLVESREQLDAVAVAVRELDVLVRSDRFLRWDDTELKPATRHRLGIRAETATEALNALNDSVRARRLELGLAIDADHEVSTPPVEKPHAGEVVSSTYERDLLMESPIPTSDLGEPAADEDFTPGENTVSCMHPDGTRSSPDAPNVDTWTDRVLGLTADVRRERRRRLR